MSAVQPAAGRAPERSVRHVGCPACGAALPLREDARCLRCRSCGTRSVLAGSDAPTRFQVLPKVSRESAVATVRAALRQWPVRSGTDERAAVVACDLVWAPFHEFEAVQAGTVQRSRGVREVRSGRVDWSAGRRRFLDAQGREIEEHEHYRRTKVEVLDTSVLLRHHRAESPAGGPRDWGLASVSVAALREDPDVRFVPRGSPEAPPGHFLPTTRRREDVEADLLRRIAAPGRTDVDLLAPDLRTVHVPLWVVRLRTGGHPYAFVVDAVRGNILSGRAPEAPRRGVLFVVLVGAYLGLPIGKVIAAAASAPDGSFVRVAAAALGFTAELGVFALVVPALLLVPLAWAWGEFRFRGEVVFDAAGARVVKSSRPAQTFLEKVIDKMLDAADRAAQRHPGSDSWWDRP